MASEGINTALGFAVGTLPQSSFDPVAYALGKAKEKKAEKKAAKVKEAQDLQETLESINPELGRSKWFAYYSGEGQKLQDDYRKKYVDIYSKQGGKLTAEQKIQSKVEQEDIKARIKMVDFSYGKLQELKKAIITNPKLNTAENQEKIRKFENPVEYDKEKLQEAGGFVEYINKRFPTLDTKVEPIDYNTLFGEISANIKPEKEDVITGTDPLTGKARIDTTEQQDVVDFQDALRENYRTNVDRYSKDYPTEEAFIEAGMRYQQPDKKSLKLVGKEKETGVRVGLGKTSGDVKLAEYKKRITTEKGKEGNIPVRGYAFSKKDKPLRLDLLSDQIGVLSDKGFKKTDSLGKNIQFQASGIEYVPVLNEVINFKDLPSGLAKDQLINYIEEKTGDKNIIIGDVFNPSKLEEGIPLNSSILSIFEKLGLKDIVDEAPYVYGTATGLEETPGEEEITATGEVVKGKPTVKTGKAKAYYIPYSEVKAQLKLHGVEFDDPQPKGAPETSEEALRGVGEAVGEETIGIQGTVLEGKPDGTKVRNKAGKEFIKKGNKLIRIK